MLRRQSDTPVRVAVAFVKRAAGSNRHPQRARPKYPFLHWTLSTLSCFQKLTYCDTSVHSLFLTHAHIKVCSIQTTNEDTYNPKHFRDRLLFSPVRRGHMSMAGETFFHSTLTDSQVTPRCSQGHSLPCAGDGLNRSRCAAVELQGFGAWDIVESPALWGQGKRIGFHSTILRVLCVCQIAYLFTLRLGLTSGSGQPRTSNSHILASRTVGLTGVHHEFQVLPLTPQMTGVLLQVGLKPGGAVLQPLCNVICTRTLPLSCRVLFPSVNECPRL